MSHSVPERDPRSEFEDQGIPDLQDGTPGQQRAVDPQQAPLPGDQPMAVDDFGTTADEQIDGEPLDQRVDREVAEDQAMFGDDGAPVVQPAQEDRTGGSDQPDPLTEDSGLGVGADLDTEYEPADAGTEPGWNAQPEEPSGQVWEEPRPAGRLIAPDEGAHSDEEGTAVADEAGPDSGGFAAEEAAMRVDPE